MSVLGIYKVEKSRQILIAHHPLSSSDLLRVIVSISGHCTAKGHFALLRIL